VFPAYDDHPKSLKLMPSYIYQDQLESQRLITRKLNEGDIPLWADFFKDKETVKFLPEFGVIPAEYRSKLWIERQLKRYEENKFGLQALIDKKTGQFIGQCGLLAQEIDEKKEIEVGYHLLKKYWGQGYAPEAARLFIAYAFKNKLANSVISIIDVKNFNSQRVAEKNALKRERQLEWCESDVFIYRIDKLIGK
jgi:ribosomal-protein-alanine N-acetyltransferase